MEYKPFFANEECTVTMERYSKGDRIALILWDNNGDCMAYATVNLPDEPCAPDEVFIKNYSENEGILQALIAAGVIKASHRKVITGFASVHVCKLLMPINH